MACIPTWISHDLTDLTFASWGWRPAFENRQVQRGAAVWTWPGHCDFPLVRLQLLTLQCQQEKSLVPTPQVSHRFASAEPWALDKITAGHQCTAGDSETCGRIGFIMGQNHHVSSRHRLPGIPKWSKMGYLTPTQIPGSPTVKLPSPERSSKTAASPCMLWVTWAVHSV